ncbi:hypothetical protein [Dolichospermum phage Dfl-JY45]
MSRTRAIHTHTLRLSAHTPLNADEREVAIRRQRSQARVRQWGVAPILLFAGFALGGAIVRNYLADYHTVINVAATVVFGGFFALILMGAGAAVLHALLPFDEADHKPLSPYWHQALESATAPFPEIDAVRHAWLREQGSLTGLEYRLLTKAVRDAQLQSGASPAPPTIASRKASP